MHGVNFAASSTRFAGVTPGIKSGWAKQIVVCALCGWVCGSVGVGVWECGGGGGGGGGVCVGGGGGLTNPEVSLTNDSDGFVLRRKGCGLACLDTLIDF